MSAVEKLISQWRKWINRNKTFTPNEMDELENHLLEEIDDLKQYEGLSEEEAFQKVVSVMGGREALDKEFVKAKPQFSISRVNHWAHSKLWTIILCLILGFSFIVSDLVYSMNHYTEELKVIDKGRINFNDIQENQVNKVFYNSLNAYFKEEFIENSKIYYRWVKIDESMSETIPEQRISWSNQSFRSQTEPKSISMVTFRDNSYFLVIDTQNTLWMSETKEFDLKSQHFQLDSKGERILVWEDIVKESTKNFTKLFIKPGSNLDFDQFDTQEPSLSFLDKGSSSIIYLKTKNSFKLIRIEFFKLRNQYKRPYKRDIVELADGSYRWDFQKEVIHDCILWEEVKIIHKPIHLWNRRVDDVNHK